MAALALASAHTSSMLIRSDTLDSKAGVLMGLMLGIYVLLFGLREANGGPVWDLALPTICVAFAIYQFFRLSSSRSPLGFVNESLLVSAYRDRSLTDNEIAWRQIEVLTYADAFNKVLIADKQRRVFWLQMTFSMLTATVVFRVIMWMITSL